MYTDFIYEQEHYYLDGNQTVVHLNKTEIIGLLNETYMR